MLLERASKGGAAELTVTGDELQRLPCGTQGMKAVAEVFKDYNSIHFRKLVEDWCKCIGYKCTLRGNAGYLHPNFAVTLTPQE